MSRRVPRGRYGLSAGFILVILTATGVLSQNPPTAPTQPQNPVAPMQPQNNDQVCADQQSAAPSAKRIKYPAKDSMNWYPLEKEIALGQEQSRQFETSVKLVDDRAVLDYIDAIAQKLERNSATKVPVHFKVVASSEPNIFTFPGGFVYLTSEAIRQAANEDELAGVMAHGMAHVNARHATRMMTRANLARMMSLPLIFGSICDGNNCADGLALPLTYIKFHREFEFEADSLAVQYLANAGYDPAAYVRWLGKLGNLADPKLQSFSPFPPAQERIRRVQKEIAELSPAGNNCVRNSTELEEIKKRLPLTDVKPPDGNGNQKPELIRHLAEESTQQSAFSPETEMHRSFDSALRMTIA